VALVTCAEYPDGYVDDVPIVARLADHDIAARFAVWGDPNVDWGAFDAAILRSTWDYPPRRDEFLDWAATVPNLLNPLAVVRWSSDKRYLRELAARGAPCIPTTFVEPRSTPGTIADSIEAVAATASRFVVKPSVGAGSIDAGRFESEDPASVEIAVKHTTSLVESGRAAMLQPYLDGVDAAGETALIYIDGECSHAIRKEALLDGAPTEVDGLFVEERTWPTTVTDDARAAGDAVLAAAPFSPSDLLYARVDLLPDADGRPLLLELELVEPSLFLSEQPGATDRLAAAIARRCRG
jgi:glutathione synthase/RimK-type ligase-like ATP-grasp enzyme